MDSTPLAVTAVRILVIDDFEPWRNTICSMLTAQDNLCVVGQAADGLEAVRKANLLNPDLIFLDISLPLLDGIKAATRIFQLRPDTKIIFLTQHSDPEIVRAALNTGAHGYILKSDAGMELLSAIAGVVRGDLFLTRELKDHPPIERSDD